MRPTVLDCPIPNCPKTELVRKIVFAPSNAERLVPARSTLELFVLVQLPRIVRVLMPTMDRAPVLVIRL